MPKQTFSKISPKVLRVKTSEMTGTLLSVNVWVFFFQCLPVSHCHHSFFRCSCPLFTSPRLISAYSHWPQPCILYCTLCMVITAMLMTFSFWWHWGVNLGVHASKAGALLIQPRSQSIFLWGLYHLFA
jgi:hypothetical protein